MITFSPPAEILTGYKVVQMEELTKNLAKLTLEDQTVVWIGAKEPNPYTRVISELKNWNSNQAKGLTTNLLYSEIIG